MRFHALALCLVGVAATVIPASADEYRSTVQGERVNIRHKSDQSTDANYYQEERMYFIGNLYPDLPPESEVAAKVQSLVVKQKTEIAHLSAFIPSARTAGYENVAMVFDTMEDDHARLVDFASDWLSDRGYAVPAGETVALTDMGPAASVDHMIAMHEQGFNDALAARQGEKSSTVRGMLLWSAATSARHLSWLRQLDRDVEHGRKTASARLDATMRTDIASEQLVERITIEDREMFGVIGPTPTVLEQVVEVPVVVERTVTVEKIVEKPVDRIVERVVEKPVERIVERRIYVDRPVQSRVAGQRQIRRPAK